METSLTCYDQARDVAIIAARRAAEFIRSHVGTISESDIRSKGLHDLVTRIDEESQALIIGEIGAVFPDHEFLAEEEQDGLSRRVDSGSVPEFLWIIDPLDGTTNFTRSVPPYAVSIALQHAGRLVVGVVLDISSDDLFSAVSGCGAFQNGHQISVSTTSRLGDGLVTTGFPYRSFGHIDTYLGVLKNFMQTARGVRRPGSAAVDLAWVAAGRFDAFYETGLMPWDVAAGIVLVREAGGTISDYRGGKSPRLGAQILATNGVVHEETLGIVAPMSDVYE